MALISWGCRLEFSKVSEQEVRDFIIEKGILHTKISKYLYIISNFQENSEIFLLKPFLSTLVGLNGPEGNMPKDGQYDYELILSSAKLHGVAPTAMNDGKLCVKDEI